MACTPARGRPWAPVGVALLFCGGAIARADAARPAPAPAAGATILSQDSFWRFHVTMRKPIAPTKDGEAAVLPVRVPYRSYPGLEEMETPAPPAAWRQCEFDDTSWPRARAGAGRSGHIADTAFAPGVRFSTALLCLRGKFVIRDPAAVKAVTLFLRYRGGVAAYVNGREIARGHLPPGSPAPDTRGAVYPQEAWVDAKGEPLPGAYHADKRIKAGEKDLARRIALRDRVLGPVTVPAEHLRRGTNVLTIELHRSAYHPSARLWFRQPHSRTRPAWVPIGLSEVRLAAAGGGAVPNVARPAGLQVWNHDPNDRVNVLDYGDPAEPLRPMRLLALRNGAFSAKVVMGSTQPIRRPRASATPLKSPDGAARIDAGRVEIRFGVLNGRAYQRPDWFDGLTADAPGQVAVHETGGAVLPVWVTVHVPRDAAPGEYRGTLTLRAEGEQPVGVPIHLRVVNWALPDPRDFRTYVGVYQSPTSLALQYKVAEWSPPHWRLMERSFELLAQIGNKIVNIPISNRTQFGNDQGMVYWRKRADGSFDYDFSVLDRYLHLVKRHLGRPDVVALHVWHSGGWKDRGADQQNTVTVVDSSGRRSRMQVPTFGTEASRGFWKPVLDAIRKRLAEHGMEQAMCLGILSDGTAPPEVFAAFDEIWGGTARWMRGCHRPTRKEAPYPLKGGGEVVCHEFCYGMAMADPTGQLPAIWKQRSYPGVAFIRHNFDERLSLLKYRTMAERSLYCGTRGIGRIGLDFWNVIRDARGRPQNIYNRWPHSSCAQRSPNLYHLSWASPRGAAATARFEQFRQGVQDAEAMIFVAEAAGEHADKLGGPLARRCRQVFVDRIRYCMRRCPEAFGCVCFRTYHHGWREQTARLYQAAADAAARLRRP